MEELTYSLNGDFLFPDLMLEEAEPLEKYGLMRREFMREKRPIFYNSLLIRGRLHSHLLEIQSAAKVMESQLMEELLSRNPSPSKENQMNWIKHMNSLKIQAEEIILAELIYIR
jgi:hypothetical protein